MDIIMDVNVALAQGPVNLVPMVDDTDFKTIETAVANNAAGMDLVWNFVTTAGAYTQTAVVPASSGNYLWTNKGDGMYALQIPASGGASINNNAAGFGWFTGRADGVLPWRGPVIQFRSAALNDQLVDGSATLAVNVTQWSGANVATPDSAGHPKVTIKAGTGAGELSITSGRVLIQSGLQKGRAITNFTFMMTDASGVPLTGLTPACVRKLDAGAFAAGTISGVAETSSAGVYTCSMGTGDTNGDVVVFEATASGAVKTVIVLYMDP